MKVTHVKEQKWSFWLRLLNKLSRDDDFWKKFWIIQIFTPPPPLLLHLPRLLLPGLSPSSSAFLVWPSEKANGASKVGAPPLGNDVADDPLLLHLLCVSLLIGKQRKTGFLVVGLVRFLIMMMMNWVGLDWVDLNWNLNDLVHSPGILGLCKTDWLMMMGGSCPTTWLAAPLVRVASSSPWDWVVALLQGLKGRCDQRVWFLTTDKQRRAEPELHHSLLLLLSHYLMKIIHEKYDLLLRRKYSWKKLTQKTWPDRGKNVAKSGEGILWAIVTTFVKEI